MLRRVAGAVGFFASKSEILQAVAISFERHYIQKQIMISTGSQEGNMSADREINVVGRACPMPLVALAKEVRSLQPGQIVRIVGNDPIFEESVVEFCRERGHKIVETARDGTTVNMVIRI